MRTSKPFESRTGRHRKSRDRGFSAVEVLAAATVVAGVVAGTGVLVSHLDDADREVATVRDTASSVASVTTDPAALDAAEDAAEEAAEEKVAPAPVAKKTQELIAPVVAAPKCSTSKSDVTLEVDAISHVLGASGGTVRTEAAEARVIAKPAAGNPCTKDVRLYMGEDYAFEGRLPYGKWNLSIDLSGSHVSVPLAVDQAKEKAPKQSIGGDCGGSRSVTVKVLTEDSLLGLSGAVPGAKVTAKRVPDGECKVPGESSFTVGADGTFTGRIGHGDWMFQVVEPSEGPADFVTVGSKTDKVVLTTTVDLVD